MNALVALAQLIASGTAIANNLKPQTAKPGIQTSEFWLTGILAVWSQLSPNIHEPWNMIIPAAAVGLYTIMRGLIKVAHAFNRGQMIPDLPALPAAQDTPLAPVVDKPVTP